MIENVETVQEAAQRFGVTVRAVQKWAAAGRIPGAVKIGRSWFIPKNAPVLDEPQEPAAEEEIEEKAPPKPLRVAMPLVNSAFPVGKCKAYIKSMPDEDDRNIAMGEYYFFSGRSEEATRILEPYLDSHDPVLRYSAALVCTFANLSLGHIHLARFAMNTLQEQARTALRSDAPPQVLAVGIFTATTASVLMHLPLPQIPPLEPYLKYLPGGLKMLACYILAHKAYLEQDYSRSLAIADMGMALSPEEYPIPSIYLHIAAVMALMNLKRTEEAIARMEQAWELARHDDLIQPFGEHHGLLQGAVEVYFKKKHSKDFERIIAITYAFSAGWRKIHNPDANHDVADNLTTTEFTIAMLYNRGWSKKEIAAHMEMSDRTVAKHISAIYGKLGITDRSELGQYMLH